MSESRMIGSRSGSENSDGREEDNKGKSGVMGGFWVRFHVVAYILAGKGDGDAMRLGLRNLTFSVVLARLRYMAQGYRV
jgi:hypothetical protein